MLFFWNYWPGKLFDMPAGAYRLQELGIYELCGIHLIGSLWPYDLPKVRGAGVNCCARMPRLSALLQAQLVKG